MQLFKSTPTINFLNLSRYMYIVSIIIISIGLFSIFTKGIDKSIDFEGGTIIDIEMKGEIDNIADVNTPEENKHIQLRTNKFRSNYKKGKLYN